MQITTVKIKKRTKNALDTVKSEKESYDEIIQRLVNDSKGKRLEEELIKGYQQVGKEELSILKDWEPSSSELDHD